MVAINFSRQFADPVERGDKRQTIRRSARCKPGDQLQLYTGMRTKACRKLRDAVCAQVLPVTIDKGSLRVNGCVLTASAASRFARDDGFKDYTDMWVWFLDRYDSPVFEGVVIKWKDAP